MAMDIEREAVERIQEIGLTEHFEDIEDLEMRVHDDQLDNSLEMNLPLQETEPDNLTRGNTPYEQDLSKYPEIFHQYQENYDRFEDANRKFDTEPKGQPVSQTEPVGNPLKDHARYKKKYDVDAPRFTGTSYM